MDPLKGENTDDGLKKKSKKRKNEESSDLRGEDGNVQLCDEGKKKKKKTGVLIDTNASEAAADSNLNVGNISEKEMKKNDRNRIDEVDQGNDDKRERKKKKSKMGDEGGASSVFEASGLASFVENQTETEVVEKVEPVVDKNQKKRKKKKREEDGDLVAGSSGAGISSSGEDKEERSSNRNKGNSDQIENEVTTDVEPTENKKKKKKKKKKDELGAGSVDSELVGGTHVLSTSGEDKEERGSKRNKEKPDQIENEVPTDVEPTENKKRKKKKKKKDDLGAGSVDNELVGGTHVLSTSNGEDNSGGGSKRKKKSDASETNGRNEVNESSEQSTPSKKSKKVSFSGHDEVYTLPDDLSEETNEEVSSKGKNKVKDGGKGKKDSGDGLVRGKRFTKEEDALVKKAVLDYIEDHQLGDNGIEMLMKCKNYPELKDCWKEIGEALPYRPYVAVYYRAHILFERSETSKWTPEELEIVKKFHDKHGPAWKALAEELGKHRFHVKDAWRRIRLPNAKKGDWSQEEYQNLFNLVNMDLAMKAFEEKKSKHGMLRDNISWEAISEKLSTRTNALCCQKWYNQLTSPMVAEGVWTDADDYRLLIALSDLDAACEEDVDWDNLLEHRSGDLCQKRWKQMVRHIGQHGIKSFGEQVEILSQRYCPDLLEAREEYENKPVVD